MELHLFILLSTHVCIKRFTLQAPSSIDVLTKLVTPPSQRKHFLSNSEYYLPSSLCRFNKENMYLDLLAGYDKMPGKSLRSVRTTFGTLFINNYNGSSMFLRLVRLLTLVKSALQLCETCFAHDRKMEVEN